MAVCWMVLASAALADTTWYVVELQGQPAGWMRIDRNEAGELVTTTTAMRVAIARQGSVVVTAFSSEVVERSGGNVVSMSRTIEGDHDDHATWRFEGKTVTIERAGVYEQTPAPEGVYVGPEAERLYLARRIAQGDMTISTRVVDPLTGLMPVPTVRRRLATERLPTPGGEVEAIRFETRRGDEARVVEEWLDDQGRLVRARTSIGAITQDIRRSDEAEARRALAKPPDLIDATRVHMPGRIRGYERLREASFLLRGNAQTPALTVGHQRADRVDDGTVRVRIDLGDSGPAVELSADERALLLAPTEWLESGDELVRQLADRAAGSLPARASQAVRAEAMRGYVHRYITSKNLDVALASAATVARGREGDCTEHATLLAAMLRAGDIPSRLVAGLTYEPGPSGTASAFVYHVWVQALVEADGAHRWIDLDATQRARPRHAAQIALSISDGRQANDLWQGLAPTLGTIAIEVEATR